MALFKWYTDQLQILSYQDLLLSKLCYFLLQSVFIEFLVTVLERILADTMYKSEKNVYALMLF